MNHLAGIIQYMIYYLLVVFKALEMSPDDERLLKNKNIISDELRKESNI